jgi:antitoxin HicB
LAESLRYNARRYEKEVRRMLNPTHPTRLPRIKEALDVRGKRLVVGVEEAA